MMAAVEWNGDLAVVTANPKELRRVYDSGLLVVWDDEGLSGLMEVTARVSSAGWFEGRCVAAVRLRWWRWGLKVGRDWGFAGGSLWCVKVERLSGEVFCCCKSVGFVKWAVRWILKVSGEEKDGEWWRVWVGDDDFVVVEGEGVDDGGRFFYGEEWVWAAFRFFEGVKKFSERVYSEREKGWWKKWGVHLSPILFGVDWGILYFFFFCRLWEVCTGGRWRGREIVGVSGAGNCEGDWICWEVCELSAGECERFW